MLGYLLLIAIPLTLFAYFPTFSHVFRSDHWILINWFNTLDFNIKDIISAGFFDSFKHGRCQPLAYVILFLQYKLFGTNIFLYHLIQYTLHIINGILLFTLIKKLGVEKIYAILCSILFLTFYSHFDIITWTFHLYVVLQVTFFLLSFISILKYFERYNKIYIFLSTFFSFILLFIYEAGLFIPLASILFFVFLAKYLSNKNQVLKSGLKILVTCNILSYILWIIALVSIRSNKPALFTDFHLLKWIIRTSISIGLCIFGTLFYHNLGLPSSQTVTTDIVYLGKIPITTPFFILITIFALIFMWYFYNKDKKTKYLILLFTLICLFYLFIICGGRTLTNSMTYPYRQPRYAYFPNLIFSIIIALLMVKYKILTRFNEIIIIVLFLLFYILNTTKIYEYNEIISKQLSPIKQYINTIENFTSNKNQKNIKIFVDFPAGTKEFFWGSDIALDVYFYKKNIFTKKIYEANYIYDKNKEIHGNKMFSTKPPANRQDFTFEFKTAGLIFLDEEKNLFGEKNGNWYISITKDKKIRFAKKIGGRYKIFETKDSFMLNYRDAHLIIEREKNKITVAEYQNKYPVKINKIKVPDDFVFEFSTPFNKSLGEHYNGKDYFGLLKDLFIIIGKTKYGLSKSG